MATKQTETNTPAKPEAKFEKVLIAEGVKLAQDYLNAEQAADNNKRGLLLAAAMQYAGDVSKTKALLTGYQQGFIDNGMSEGSAKVRKSEAQAVFDALASTEVSKANHKTLSDVVGGYHAFIEKARELRGKSERMSSEKTRKAPAQMTKTQFDSVETNLEKASAEQLQVVAEQSLITMNQKAPPTLAGLNSLKLIQAAAVQLAGNPHAEEFFKVTAEKILAIVGPAIDKVADAQKQTAKIQDASKNGHAVQSEETVI